MRNNKLTLWKALKWAGGSPGSRNILVWPVRWLRILILAAASFAVNEVPVRAAALTFTTLLAFFPFIILLSALAGKLGYLHLLSKFIPYLAGVLHLDLPLDPVLTSIGKAQRIGFHRLGVWGTFGLLFTFFLSMGNVESAVNRVWNLPGKRGVLRRLKVYTPFFLLLVFLVLSGALLLLQLRHGVEKWGFTGSLTFFGFHTKSVLFGATGVMAFIWVGLALMIQILPNARVKAGPALFGATAATALIYLLSRLLFLFPKLLLAQNRFLYGSLAIFPVALLLTYAFWAAALFGAAVAFIHQSFYDGGAEGGRLGPERVQKASRPSPVWDEILAELQAVYSRRKS